MWSRMSVDLSMERAALRSQVWRWHPLICEERREGVIPHLLEHVGLWFAMAE